MDYNLNDAERLNLQKMIKTNEAEDFTQLIRKEKHSILIKEDVETLLSIKKDFSRLAKSNPESFDKLCVTRCQFLFNRYTDIFNKVKKDQLDLSILGQFLVVLKQIEDGDINQHEGSVAVGRLLKKLYIDSAIKVGDKLDEKHKKSGKHQPKPKNLSWKEYKEQNL
tara:strand:- start:1749 stop:2246 length:498 start_codon:yes stop_codon:yes gene_type:complete